MAGLIDPTVTGKYPVVLGDNLLGKTSNEIFTGVRYNHMPKLSSPDAPDRARLKPSIPGKTSSYDLNFADDDGNYSFSGARTTDDDQYVLYFDAERKAFVLDKVDSTFNMNLARVPGNSDAEELRRRYSHINLNKQPSEKETPTNGSSAAKPKPAPKPQKVSPPKRKSTTDKKPPPQQAKSMALPMPKPEPPKPKKSQFDDEDEDEDDDDGGLQIEYPGGDAPAKKNDFSPAFPTQRRFDEYMDQRESEADDEDGESDGEVDMDFKLPSPVNKGAAAAESPSGGAAEAAANGANEDDEDDGATADLEGDLENALEIAFEDLANSQEDSRGGDESEISEED